jgi:5-(carboxyamino)imidazole ribonucleotide synthase
MTDASLPADRQSPSLQTSTRSPVILPGATIGMVGGGQLGRMFTLAAASMGYRVVVLCESEQEPAPQVAHDCVVADLRDQRAVESFARQCDVITLEFENIPAETIAWCSRYAPTYPSAAVLATAQNRWREKSTLRDAGLPVTPMMRVNDEASLAIAAEQLGWPLIVKTAISGYDGKGQHRVGSMDEATQIRWSDCEDWVAEQWIDFEREVSVVVARNPFGDQQAFPVFENVHRNHILDITSVPASLEQSVAQEAVRVAMAASDVLNVVGLLCVEFFVRDSSVMINEVAPRPHNSGHLTIEACETSQFEQHVRAICNLPLGSTAMRCGAAVMVNLLGDLWNQNDRSPHWDRALQDPSVHLHLYGKQSAKAGRKMGHLTLTGDDLPSLQQRALNARRRLIE